jgi:hypothetical protein
MNAMNIDNYSPQLGSSLQNRPSLSQQSLPLPSEPNDAEPPPFNPTLQHVYVNKDPQMAEAYGPQQPSRWEEFQQEHNIQDKPYHPWSSKVEFEIVEWLCSLCLSQAMIDQFLGLDVVVCV